MNYKPGGKPHELNFISFTEYHVTGISVKGRRFKLIYNATQFGHFTAMNINLYNGSVWGVYADGRRRLLKRVIN